jgi:hypothetical protein
MVLQREAAGRTKGTLLKCNPILPKTEDLEADRAFRIKCDALQGGIFPVGESPSSRGEIFPHRINPTLVSGQDADEHEERLEGWRAEALAEAQEARRESRRDADVTTSMAASDATMTHDVAAEVSTAVPDEDVEDETPGSDTVTLPRMRSVGSITSGSAFSVSDASQNIPRRSPESLQHVAELRELIRGGII